MSLRLRSVLSFGLEEVRVSPTFIHITDFLVQHCYERLNFVARHEFYDSEDELSGSGVERSSLGDTVVGRVELNMSLHPLLEHVERQNAMGGH